MSKRSTRQKIKDQGLYIIIECRRIQEHLRNIQDFANNQSNYIEDNIPRLVVMGDEMQKVYERFCKGL